MKESGSMRTLRAALHNSVRDYRELALAGRLLFTTAPKRRPDDGSSSAVVALTSYPERIVHAWRSIETILRQDIHAGTVVLVLAESDFPRREIPLRLQRQTKRGLEILWVRRNGFSFDKLIPVRSLFPESPIITVDDDLYFPSSLVGDLVATSYDFPGAIIGARGWRVAASPDDGKLRFGDGWTRSVSGDAGRGLHLPGGNGCLYPPQSLDPMVDRLDLALELAPTNDDIWFWIHAVRAGTEFVCLGMPPHLPVKPQRRTPALSHVNRVGQDDQFQSVMRYFRVDPMTLIWRGRES